MDAKKLGTFIAEIRKEQNMTQAELAETISVSKLKKKLKNTQISIVLIFGIISILICLLVLFFVFLVRGNHHFSHMDIDFSTEIKDVTIFYGDMHQAVFSEPKQIENIIKSLNSITCHRITDRTTPKSGFLAQIDVNYYNGDMLDITFQDGNRISVTRYESYQKYPNIYKEENGKYGIDVNGQYVTVSEYLPETELKCVSSYLYKSDSDLESKIFSMVQNN